MLAQDKYQAVTNEIEEIQEVRKKVDDMRVKFEKIKEKIENNWSGENKNGEMPFVKRKSFLRLF